MYDFDLPRYGPDSEEDQPIQWDDWLGGFPIQLHDHPGGGMDFDNIFNRYGDAWPAIDANTLEVGCEDIFRLFMLSPSMVAHKADAYVTVLNDRTLDDATKKELCDCINSEYGGIEELGARLVRLWLCRGRLHMPREFQVMGDSASLTR